MAGVIESALWQTEATIASLTSSASFVKYANATGGIGIGISLAGNFVSAAITTQTGLIKGSDMLGYLATTVAIGGLIFGGITAAPVVAVIGIGFGLTQIIGGDYLDENFSYRLFTPPSTTPIKP